MVALSKRRPTPVNVELRHVDLGAFGGFVRAARAADGAVDDVHARLARDDADAAGADARVADVEIAAILGDDRIACELDGLAVDAHQPIALAEDGIGALFDIGGHGFGIGALCRALASRTGSSRVML